MHQRIIDTAQSDITHNFHQKENCSKTTAPSRGSADLSPKAHIISEKQEIAKKEKYSEVLCSYNNNLNNKINPALYDYQEAAWESIMYYFEKEHRLGEVSSFGYMKNREDINTTTRGVVIGWLTEIQECMTMKPDTLFLAIKFIDHYLSKNKIRIDNLHLLTMAAFYLACKHEEVNPPDIYLCAYAADSAYSPRDIVYMEREILGNLNFKINNATALSFLRIFCSKVTFDHHSITFYFSLLLLENSISVYESLRHKPSTLALACYYLSRILLRHPLEWPTETQTITGLSESDIRECAVEVLRFALQNIIISNLFFMPPTYCTMWHYIPTLRNKFKSPKAESRMFC